MPRMFRLLPLAAALIAALAIACAGSDGDEPAPPGTPLPDATTIAAAGCAPARPRAAGVSRETLMIGGLERSYLVRIPPGYDGTSRVPLILAFHGFATDANTLLAYTGFDTAAADTGAITVAPDGTGTPQRWYYRGAADGIDDSAFVGDVLAKLDAALCVDPDRTYAVGFSNGGGMAQRLACDMPDRIAAIGIVAASYAPCQADVPMIAFHGMADAIIPFEGGLTPPELFSIPFLPARRYVSEWAKAVGCDGLPTISRPSGEVELSTFHRCRRGDGEVLLYTILGGGHTWPGAPEVAILGYTTQEIDASETILAFFRAHPKGGPAAPSQ